MSKTQQLTPMAIVPDILDATQTYDSRRLLALLNRSWSAFGLAATVDDVLMPSMRLVGRLWASGQSDVSEEHLATVTTQLWLGQVSAAATAPTRIGTVLLACGPSDVHTLGLECLAALLMERGADCRSLGGSTPTEAVQIAVRRLRPAAVVVVSHSPRSRPGALLSIGLVDAQGIDVYYAGGAFATAEDRDGVPGRYLGEHLGPAADLVVAGLA